MLWWTTTDPLQKSMRLVTKRFVQNRKTKALVVIQFRYTLKRIICIYFIHLIAQSWRNYRKLFLYLARNWCSCAKINISTTWHWCAKYISNMAYPIVPCRTYLLSIHSILCEAAKYPSKTWTRPRLLLCIGLHNFHEWMEHATILLSFRR